MLVLAAWTSWFAIYALQSPIILFVGPAVIGALLLGLGLLDRGAHPRLLRMAIGVGLLLGVFFVRGAFTETNDGGVSVGAVFAILSFTTAGYAAIALARRRSESR